MVTTPGMASAVVLYLKFYPNLLTNVNYEKSTCVKITFNLKVQFVLLCSFWELPLMGAWLAWLGGSGTLWGKDACADGLQCKCMKFYDLLYGSALKHVMVFYELATIS